LLFVVQCPAESFQVLLLTPDVTLKLFTIPQETSPSACLDGPRTVRVVDEQAVEIPRRAAFVSHGIPGI
jgi:hypothetical protein